MISPAITAIIIAVLAAVAFIGGFAVSDWRSAAEIRQLNSDNALLSASNNKCASDIQSVRAAIAGLTTASMSQGKNAAAAMQQAGTAAAKHVQQGERYTFASASGASWTSARPLCGSSQLISKPGARMRNERLDRPGVTGNFRFFVYT